MIDRHHPIPITQQARLLGMSRGAVYYLPRPPSAADLALMRRIDEIHLEHPFMGSRQIVRVLQRQGLDVGRLHVRTLMHKMGIHALAPQPGTSTRHPGHKVFPYLLRTLAIVRSNQVWALDTTYIPMAHGFVYLTAVVDVFSRRILAHRVAITLEAVHAVEAIQEAIARFAPQRLSTPTRAASSPPRTSSVRCRAPGPSSRWMAAVPGATTCSLNASGARSNTSGCTCGPTPA